MCGQFDYQVFREPTLPTWLGDDIGLTRDETAGVRTGGSRIGALVRSMRRAVVLRRRDVAPMTVEACDPVLAPPDKGVDEDRVDAAA